MKTQKKVVHNSLNYDWTKTKRRHLDEVSLTVPDQTMTVRQMLARHGRGLLVTGVAGEPSFSEEELPDLRTLDIEEIRQIRAENSANISRLQAELEKEHNEKKMVKLRESIQMEMEAKAAELAAQSKMPDPKAVA